MSEILVRIVRDMETNPNRTWLLEVKGADGKWVPFGNHVTEEEANAGADECVALWGFTKV